MDPILIFRHGPDIPAGYLADAIAETGIPAETVPLYAGASVPDHLDWTGIVSLGGEMGAYDEDRFPYLSEEKAFLRKAADTGLPVLGICLGCQLLADSLGGRAYRAPAIELGHMEVTLTVLGREDPVVSHLDGPTVVWHHDTWEPPPGVDLLAETDAYPQAFRIGNVVGIQPHPEISPEIARTWAGMVGDDDFVEAGVDGEEFLAAVEANREQGEEMARRIFGAWLESLGG